jgi:hypothetical protein
MRRADGGGRKGRREGGRVRGGMKGDGGEERSGAAAGGWRILLHASGFLDLVPCMCCCGFLSLLSLSCACCLPFPALRPPSCLRASLPLLSLSTGKLPWIPKDKETKHWFPGVAFNGLAFNGLACNGLAFNVLLPESKHEAGPREALLGFQHEHTGVGLGLGQWGQLNKKLEGLGSLMRRGERAHQVLSQAQHEGFCRLEEARERLSSIWGSRRRP